MDQPNPDLLADLAFAICDGIQATDDGMKMGYGWKWGPLS